MSIRPSGTFALGAVVSALALAGALAEWRLAAAQESPAPASPPPVEASPAPAAPQAAPSPAAPVAPTPAGVAAANEVRAALGSPSCGGTNKAARCHLQLDLPDPTPGARREHYSGITEQVRFRELSVWRQHGGHARAFERLASERAKTMADQLAYFEAGQKEPDPARKDPQQRADCLSCHALRTGAPGDRTRALEGVSCESCHGNAGSGKTADGKVAPGWIDAHAEPGWRARPRAEWESHGMMYTPEVRVVARTCLECHLGTGEGEHRYLSHELYAAGHPPLSFELVTDLALAPHHFRERVGADLVPLDRQPWFYARLWAVGQAVALAETMHRLERALRKSDALDLSFMECFACHHPLDTSQTRRSVAGWRQGTRGFFGEPGEPVLALETWMVARHVAQRLLPKEGFDKLVADVVLLFGSASLRGVKDREGAAAAAGRAAAAAEDLAARAEQQLHVEKADPAAEAKATLEVLREVAGDGEIPYYGFRASEQQAKAIYVLYLVGYGRSEYRPANDERVRSRLDELFGRLYSASREPRPGDYELTGYQTSREALARELPLEPQRH